MARPTMSRRRVAIAAVAAAALLSPVDASRAQGIDLAREWSWSTLRAVPDVDTAQVAWLEANVPLADARPLLATIAELSKPEVAQLLAPMLYLDGSVVSLRAVADSLYRRPPAGVPGIVHVAYVTSKIRKDLIDRMRSRGVFRTEFAGEPLRVPATPKRPWPRGVSLRLAFDFAPAETLLAIIGTRDIGAAAAERRIATPPFDALISHHSQSFYPVPLSRERLAANLAHAASTDPLDRLYRWTQPLGLLHYTDVSAHRGEYAALLRTLGANERAILDHVAASIAPYLPPGTTLSRTVSFFFADGADGWAGSGIAAAVDLEYFKDDYPRLLNVLVHETFHAAQGAVRAAQPPRPPIARSPADSALLGALDQLLIEGTANFVAPATTRSDADARAMAEQGARIIEQLLAATTPTLDRARVLTLMNQGVASGGPFYWTGALMSRTIARALGDPALAATLTGDGASFFETYERARARSPDGPTLFGPELAAAVRRLAR